MKQDYPFVWDRHAMPSGRFGKRCRIVGNAGKMGKSQGLVLIRFAEGGPNYAVAKSGLRRVEQSP